MATELGVSQWWRPEPEHSRCFAGARGDVIGETVCSHGHQEKCTAACAVAVRLHPLGSDGGNLSRGVSAQASGGKRVILIRKIGVRVAAVPSGMMSRSFKEFSSPLQREQQKQQPQPAAGAIDAIGLIPPPPADGQPVRVRTPTRDADDAQIRALGAANEKLSAEVAAMKDHRKGMDLKFETMQGELRKILQAVSGQEGSHVI